ncbi:uncharacterized protein LOC141713523 [Apium graveolens]|uniref:uncharacterized protein LOC141713523 n=1 Tax=Apium graveolens TaxID=4045 RepID=UPI003D79FE01
MVNQLRDEAKKQKESSREDLQDTINELKAEKNEVRDEKQKLKAEKEKLEQQGLHTQPGFLPSPGPDQFFGGETVPFILEFPCGNSHPLLQLTQHRINYSILQLPKFSNPPVNLKLPKRRLVFPFVFG